MPLHLVPKRTRLRAAVIGAGVFGRLHIAKYLSIPGVELAAIADPSEKARAAVELKFGLPAHADWRDLAGEVDLVSICSPANTHGELVRGFLEAGAHVLVEKPIATSLDEAEDLIALAAARGRILTVGHQERFVLANSGLLESAEAPLGIECVRAGPWTGRGTDVGAVLDLMIHDLDFVHCLVPGEPGDIRATARAERGHFADETTANLTFDHGTEVKLFASRISETRKRTMRLAYADGVVEIDFLARKIGNTTSLPLGGFDFDDPLGKAIMSFVAAVEGGPATPIRPEEARRALGTALAIEEAAALGAVPAREIRAPAGVALSA